MRILFLIICFLILHMSAAAQGTRIYALTHVTTADNLASNSVNSTAQDKAGYIWIATSNGLQRYDGKFLITFPTPTHPVAFPSRHISTMFIDSKGLLWLLFENGTIGTFDPINFLFTPTKIESGKIENIDSRAIRFLELFNGEVLLHNGRDGKMYSYQNATRSLIAGTSSIPLPPGWTGVNKIFVDKEKGRYWMSSDKGLAMYNPVNKQLSHKGNNVEKVSAVEDVDGWIYNIHVDRNGDIIFITWPVHSSVPFVNLYHTKNRSFEKFALHEKIDLQYHEIDVLLEQRNGRLWIGGSPFLTEWVNNKNEFLKVPSTNRHEQNLRFDYLQHIFEDKDQNLWLSTDNGIYYFNPNSQPFFINNLQRFANKNIFDAPVQCMAENAGTIFIGTWSQGLFCYDKEFNPIKIPNALTPYTRGAESIWDMLFHSKTGKLWMVFQGGYIVVYNPKNGKAERVDPPIFESRTIRQVTEDADGNLWFGTQGGRLIKWDFSKSDNNPKQGYRLVFTKGRIDKLFTDNRGTLWVSVAGNGLVKVDTRNENIIDVYKNEKGAKFQISNNSPGDIVQVNDSTIVVLTNAIHFINLNSGKVQNVTVHQGLPSAVIYSAHTDNSGNLWLGMVNGLCHFNIKNRKFTVYDRSDGLINDKFSLVASYKLKDGRLFFGTNHDFVIVNPSILMESSNPPKPVISKISSGQVSYLIDSLFQNDGLRISHNQNSISIVFSALNYSRQNKTHYYYMLEGLDKEWKHATEPMQAVYNYLPPGDYVFKIRCENEQGISSEVFHSFPIEVDRSLLQSWWLYGLIALIAATILIMIDKERIKRLKSLQQIRSDIAGNLHHEVSTALININVLSEIAKVKAEKNIEQSKDFLQQISTQSSNMIQSLDDMLWTIAPENDSMNHLLGRIKEMTEGIRTTYNVDIDFIVEKNVYNIKADMKVRHKLHSLYKVLLTSLVCDGFCRQVFVYIKHKSTNLVMEIITECDDNMQSFAMEIESKFKEKWNADGIGFDVESEHKHVSVQIKFPLK